MNKEAFTEGYMSKEAGFGNAFNKLKKTITAPARLDRARSKAWKKQKEHSTSDADRMNELTKDMPYHNLQITGIKWPKEVSDHLNRSSTLMNRAEGLDKMKRRMLVNRQNMKKKVQGYGKTGLKGAAGAGAAYGLSDYAGQFWDWLNGLLAQNRLDPKFDQER
jgi:hypothetical protein